MSQQLRTVHLDPIQSNGDGRATEQRGVLIAAIGTLRHTTPGQSVRKTLEVVGIPLPAQHQTIRINNELVRDLGRTVKEGDKLTIVNRVVGG